MKSKVSSKEKKSSSYRVKPNVAYCEELNFFYDFNTGTYFDVALSED